MDTLYCTVYSTVEEAGCTLKNPLSLRNRPLLLYRVQYHCIQYTDMLTQKEPLYLPSVRLVLKHTKHSVPTVTWLVPHTNDHGAVAE